MLSSVGGYFAAAFYELREMLGVRAFIELYESAPS